MLRIERLAFAALLGLTALRLVVAAWMPLLPDEAYYWVWSRALAPGYFDHPPMVALWIAAGTALAGEGALGVRLLAPSAALLGSLMLARAARDLLPGEETARREAGVLAAALLNATLLFGAGSVTMTTFRPSSGAASPFTTSIGDRLRGDFLTVRMTVDDETSTGAPCWSTTRTSTSVLMPATMGRPCRESNGTASDDRPPERTTPVISSSMRPP